MNFDYRHDEDDALLRDLVDKQSERIDVEYKNWLQVSDNETKAKIAKHLCALANAGGGYLIFGKDDNGQFSEPHPGSLDAWSHDALNGIVNLIIPFTHPAMMTRYGCGAVRAQA